MKRDALYRFCFEDGEEVVTANMTCDLARELMAKHGKFTEKRFVSWVENKNGGNNDVATCI